MSKQQLTEHQTKNDPSSTTPKTISEVLGIDPLLPGEPQKEYHDGLRALIAELDAKSPLQIYLAEKIYDSLWWIRRYDGQKRATIIAEMALLVSGVPERSMDKQQISEQKYLRETLLKNQWDQTSVDILNKTGFSRQSLRQAAMSKRRDELEQLDQQIALQAKVLAGFQASYEVAFNRKRNVERLDLQNALLRRDLDAIEGKVVNDKPKTKGR